MIAVLDVWNRISAYSQKYQSGMDTVAYFNSALDEVQLELFNDFSPLYDASEKVKTLMDFWVNTQSGNSNSDGTLILGTDPQIVNRPLALGYTDGAGNVLFSIPSISESELISSYRIPQRAPNVTSKKVYYRFNYPGNVTFYPSTTIPYSAFYLIYPLEASIAFTYTSTDDEDVMTYDPTDSIDLQWPDSAYNLIIYKMLEKYGVSVREELLTEYAKYGVIQTASSGEGAKA